MKGSTQTAVSYEARCDAATTAQGLDPAVAALRAAGIPVQVWQTGGFCMVAAVPDAEGEGVIAITGDVGAYWYPDDGLQEDSVEVACAPSGGVYETDEQTADLVRRIIAFRAGQITGYAVALRTQSRDERIAVLADRTAAMTAAEAARQTQWSRGFAVTVAILDGDS